jgi:hypothetical protein
MRAELSGAIIDGMFDGLFGGLFAWRTAGFQTSMIPMLQDCFKEVSNASKL